MKNKINILSRIKISLKTALPLMIIIMVVFLVVSILYFSYQSNKYATFKITEKLMYQIFSTTAEKLNSYFESSTLSLRDLEFTLKENKFDFKNNPQVFLEYLKKLLVINPNITRGYLGDENGSFYMAKRMTDGSISYRVVKQNNTTIKSRWIHANPKFSKDFPSTISRISDGYDPRRQPWYKAAQEANRLIWTEPHIFPPNRLLGISVASPINNSKIKGVFAIDFNLSEINNFIKNIFISQRSSLFIFDKSDNIIAYSSPNKSIDLMYKVVNRDGYTSIDLLTPSDINDSVLIELYSQYKNKITGDEFDSSLYNNLFFTSILNLYIGSFIDQDNLSKENRSNLDDIGIGLDGVQEHNNESYYASYELGDETYLFMLNEFNISDYFKPKLGIIIPQQVVVSYFNYTYQIIFLFTVGVVCIGLIIIVIFVNCSISKPILNFSKKMSEMVSNFQLDPFVDKQSGLTEISHIRKSMENVRQAFVSFKKYLPKEIMADLVSSGKEITIGGEKKEITIFFSNIKDFTKISEENPTDIVFQKLEIYFRLVNYCITINKGVLDKYIGDAVMAMWGVPIPLANHAVGACLAAIEIKQGLIKLNKKLADEKFPIFITRIGIHTGIILVGNIGSENRMNYTCIGDGINLASRLERLNKFYHTQILVSNMSLQHVKEFVEHRVVDRILVKGKPQRILIHEIIAKKGELYGNDKIFLKHYKEGIRFYIEGYWDDAIRSLSSAQKINPNDHLTQLYLDKANSFISRKIEDINSDELYLDRRLSRS